MQATNGGGRAALSAVPERLGRLAHDVRPVRGRDKISTEVVASGSSMRALLAPGISRPRAQGHMLFRVQRRVSAGDSQRQLSTQASAITHRAAMRRLWRSLHAETRQRQVLLGGLRAARLWPCVVALIASRACEFPRVRRWPPRRTHQPPHHAIRDAVKKSERSERKHRDDHQRRRSDPGGNHQHSEQAIFLCHEPKVAQNVPRALSSVFQRSPGLGNSVSDRPRPIVARGSLRAPLARLTPGDRSALGGLPRISC